jgi:hypothetical protein
MQSLSEVHTVNEGTGWQRVFRLSEINFRWQGVGGEKYGQDGFVVAPSLGSLCQCICVWLSRC